jgi:hypothetical protein
MHGPRRNDTDPNATGQSRSASRRNQRFTSSLFSFFLLMMYMSYYTHIQFPVKNFLPFRPEKIRSATSLNSQTPFHAVFSRYFCTEN